MQTETKNIPIEVPAGYDVEFDGKAIRVKEKPKDVMQRITSIESALADLGEDDNEVVRYRKLTAALTDPTDHLVNYQTAVVLIRAINEKREPNWDDDKEKKWYMWFNMSGSSGFRFDGCDYWFSDSDVGSRLCVFDPKHGKYLTDQFPEVFRHFMLIIK